MTNQVSAAVDYASAARRHFVDGESLFGSGRMANAGQLFGFVAECGVKAMLVACQVPTDSKGSIPSGNKFRQHVPKLVGQITAQGHLIPDGRMAQTYMATMPSLSTLSDWSIDHRYWRETALPITSVTAWRTAANEVLAMLDRAKEDGAL